jgi:hypothetical protein
MKTKTQTANDSHERARKLISRKPAVASKSKKAARTTDWIDKVSGVLDGPGDLNTNPKYMEDYGQ